MNIKALCLKILAWIFVAIGGALSVLWAPYILLLFFALALFSVLGAKTIEKRQAEKSASQ